jgi:hypothetical protein
MMRESEYLTYEELWRLMQSVQENFKKRHEQNAKAAKKLRKGDPCEVFEQGKWRPAVIQSGYWESRDKAMLGQLSDFSRVVVLFFGEETSLSKLPTAVKMIHVRPRRP